MSHQSIEPCPFCGAQARAIYVSDFRISSPRTGRRVVCDVCAASSRSFGTETEAVDAWNTRAIPSVKREPLTWREAEKLFEEARENLSDLPFSLRFARMVEHAHGITVAEASNDA